jgi:hypothetical protein
VHAEAGKRLLDQCDDLSFLCRKQDLPRAVRKARILPARCLRLPEQARLATRFS